MKRDDVVEIASPGRYHHGKQGTITEALERPAGVERYRVAHADGMSAWYGEKELVMVESKRNVENDYPIGASVLIASNGVVAVVDGTVCGSVIVKYPNGQMATFPDPYAGLSVVYLLTKEELLTIDDSIPEGPEYSAAQEIVNKHLRPTVKHRFLVEIEQPANARKMVDSAFVHTKLTSGDYTGLPVVVEIEGEKR